MTPARWLTTEHAAQYLDFSTSRAFYIWAKRNAIPYAHRGRILIFWSADLDKALEKHGADSTDSDRIRRNFVSLFQTVGESSEWT